MDRHNINENVVRLVGEGTFDLVIYCIDCLFWEEFGPLKRRFTLVQNSLSWFTVMVKDTFMAPHTCDLVTVHTLHVVWGNQCVFLCRNYGYEVAGAAFHCASWMMDDCDVIQMYK